MTDPTQDATHPASTPQMGGNPRGNNPGTTGTGRSPSQAQVAADPTSAVNSGATHPGGAAGVLAAPQGQPEDNKLRFPRRIQRQRTKGWRMPDGAVYVGRGTVWGNPWKLGADVRIESVGARQVIYSLDLEWAVKLYRLWIQGASRSDIPLTPERLRYRDLTGLDLACWCPITYPDGRRHPCHADVLLELANPGWTP